jgi:hypothetical protein
MNSFITVQRGTLSQAQERALVHFVIRLGRTRFARYRWVAGVGGTPITRLTKSEAWRLMQVTIQNLETAK